MHALFGLVARQAYRARFVHLHCLLFTPADGKLLQPLPSFTCHQRLLPVVHPPTLTLPFTLLSCPSPADEKFLQGSSDMPHEGMFVTNPLSAYVGGPEDSSWLADVDNNEAYENDDYALAGAARHMAAAPQEVVGLVACGGGSSCQKTGSYALKSAMAMLAASTRAAAAATPHC
jgi:hypothetical protein